MVRGPECVICGASIYSYDHFPNDSLPAQVWMSRFRFSKLLVVAGFVLLL